MGFRGRFLVCVCVCMLLGNPVVGNWPFLLIHILLLFSFGLMKLQWIKGRKKTRIPLNSISIFVVYEYFVVENDFLNQ